MGLNYVNLNRQTRDLMLEEIIMDIRNGELYISKNLTEQGQKHYPHLFMYATVLGNDDTFAENLVELGYILPGKVKMLAEGEFNRYYIRGVCRLAMAAGIPEVEVYRAKEVKTAKEESVDRIGLKIPADKLLEDLRTHKTDTVYKVPNGPFSGISVKLTV